MFLQGGEELRCGVVEGAYNIITEHMAFEGSREDITEVAEYDWMYVRDECISGNLREEEGEHCDLLQQASLIPHG